MNDEHPPSEKQLKKFAAYLKRRRLHVRGLEHFINADPSTRNGYANGVDISTDGLTCLKRIGFLPALRITYESTIWLSESSDCTRQRLMPAVSMVGMYPHVWFFLYFHHLRSDMYIYACNPEDPRNQEFRELIQ